MLFHRLLEQPAGAMQARLHGLRQNAEQLRGLLDAHALDQARDQHGAERFRQLVDGALEQDAQLALRDGGLGIELAIGIGERDDLRLQGGIVVDDIERHGPATAAQAAERLVHDDAGEPGAEPRLAAKAREAGEGARIGLLQRVLRLAVVAQDTAGDAVETLVVLADDQPHRRRLAAAGLRDQFGFIRKAWRDRTIDHRELHSHDDHALDAVRGERFPKFYLASRLARQMARTASSSPAVGAWASGTDAARRGLLSPPRSSCCSRPSRSRTLSSRTRVASRIGAAAGVSARRGLRARRTPQSSGDILLCGRGAPLSRTTALSAAAMMGARLAEAGSGETAMCGSRVRAAAEARRTRRLPSKRPT